MKKRETARVSREVRIVNELRLHARPAAVPDPVDWQGRAEALELQWYAMQRDNQFGSAGAHGLEDELGEIDRSLQTAYETGAASNVLCDDGHGQGVDCSTAPFVFAGTPTPPSFGSIGNTFTLFRKLRLYALVDWKHGNRLANASEEVRCAGLIGIGLSDANYHPS